MPYDAFIKEFLDMRIHIILRDIFHVDFSLVNATLSCCAHKSIGSCILVTCLKLSVRLYMGFGQTPFI